jgi:hypothetical protein
MAIDWLKGANWTYNATPNENGEHNITFSFPNAAIGKIEWTDWLYRTKKDHTIDKNMTAEILQSLMDLYFEEHPTSKGNN